MPLEGVLVFSHARTHGCFLALGYCCRGLGFHHSFIRRNLSFLSAQKDSHRHGEGYPRLSLPKSAKQPLFPAQGHLPAPALVDGNLVWPRGPRTPLCCSAGATQQQYTSPVLLTRKHSISNLLTVPSTLGKGLLALLPMSVSNLATDVGLPDITYVFTCSLRGRSKDRSSLAYHTFVFLQCFH